MANLQLWRDHGFNTHCILIFLLHLLRFLHLLQEGSSHNCKSNSISNCTSVLIALLWNQMCKKNLTFLLRHVGIWKIIWFNYLFHSSTFSSLFSVNIKTQSIPNRGLIQLNDECFRFYALWKLNWQISIKYSINGAYIAYL